jgi:hypothetical protein
MDCPNSTESGCLCPEHNRGLLAFTVSDEHHTLLASALDQLRDRETTTLRVLTFDPEPPDNVVQLERACDGTYECECADCLAVIADRVRRGIKRSHALPIKWKRAA